MWQAPNQRVRSIANAKKRERERAKKPIHIKRINALIELLPLSEEKNPASAEKVNIRLILNDVTTKGASFFARSPLTAGQKITLYLEEPTKIVIQAQVRWCQEYAANSHVLSQQPYSYRLGIEFILGSAEEQDAAKAFYDRVYQNHLYPNRIAA
jgi:hypothetical protein